MPHRARDRSAAQQRLDAHDQLGECERLGEVVVGAGLKIVNLVLGGAARRQDQDGHALVGSPDPAQHFLTGELRQHQIEDDQIVFVSLRELPATQAILGHIDRIALRAQRPRHELGNLLLVFHQQQSHGSPAARSRAQRD